jgi:hypothetical protein
MIWDNVYFLLGNGRSGRTFPDDLEHGIDILRACIPPIRPPPS